MAIYPVSLNKLVSQAASELKEVLVKKAVKEVKAAEGTPATSSMRASEVRYTESSVVAAAKTLFCSAFVELKGEALNEFEEMSAKLLATEVAKKVMEEKEA